MSVEKAEKHPTRMLRMTQKKTIFQIRWFFYALRDIIQYFENSLMQQID